MAAPDDALPPGLRRRTVDATPEVPDLFRGYARGGYSIPDAIAEYVDNSLDQIGNNASGWVKVDFSASGSMITVTIRDNGGGCPEGHALRFIKPGETGTLATSTGISRFGMGGKTAGLSVARQIRVYSRIRGENGFLVILDKAELMSKSDWKFVVYDIPADYQLAPGETVVELRGMGTEAHARRDHYRARFAERYAVLLKQPTSPKVYVAGVAVVARDPYELQLRDAEIPAGCAPRKVEVDAFYKLLPTDAAPRTKVHSRITVGLGPSGSTSPDKGARIYCNGRAVGGVSQLGMSSDEDDLIHTSDDLTWLRAVVELEGPAELMPWTNRKDRLDPSAPTYPDLEQHLRNAYAEFLEEAVTPAKARLKAERGKGSRTPRLSEVLEAFWRRRIESGSMKPDTVRPLLRAAPTFQKAAKPLSTEPPPGPPSGRDRGIARLQANVDVNDVERAKKLIVENFGSEDVSDSDVVRILLKHFLECPTIVDEENPPAATSTGSGQSTP